MNTVQKDEVDQWLIACKDVLGEDNVIALIEHGYFMAIESVNKPLASEVADPYDFLLETPLELKPKLAKHISLFELEAFNRGHCRLVVLNG